MKTAGARWLVLMCHLVGSLFLVAAIGGKPLHAADYEVLMREGIALRRSGDDAAALKHFQQAYELNKSAKALGQIGLAEQALGHWAAADKHLRQALESQDDAWIRKNLGAMNQALSLISTHVGQIEISGTPAGAEVRVDGEPVGRLPLAHPITATAGGVAVEVRSAGYVPIVRAATVLAHTLTRETFTLQSMAPVPDVPLAHPMSTPGSRAGSHPATGDASPKVSDSFDSLSGSASGSGTAGGAPGESNSSRVAGDSARSTTDAGGGGTGRQLALIAGGLAVASLVFGVVEQITWQRKVNSFGSNPACGSTFANRGASGCMDLYDGGQLARTLTFVGYGLAGAFAGAALIFYFTDSTPVAAPGKVACAPALETSGVSCVFRF